MLTWQDKEIKKKLVDKLDIDFFLNANAWRELQFNNLGFEKWAFAYSKCFLYMEFQNLALQEISEMHIVTMITEYIFYVHVEFLERFQKTKTTVQWV